MTKTTASLLMAVLMASGCVQASAESLKVGEPAPGFTLPDEKGRKRSLSGEKGKWVVLEWLNHGCPYVVKHYQSGNMSALQKRYSEKGVVWYSVISSAPGTQGHSTPKEAAADAKKHGSKAAAILLDPEGEVGRLYGAQTTPHMYVIDPKGVLVYQGAIDSIRSTDVDDIAEATNYVSAALDAAMAGKPVLSASTKAYGCSVKYGSASKKGKKGKKGEDKKRKKDKEG